MDSRGFLLASRRQRRFQEFREARAARLNSPSAPGKEGHSFMLHVTCDLCGKELCPGQDQRFVVKMEVFAAHDPAKITEADLDDDHMEAVCELLREMEDNPDDVEAAEPAYKHIRYD